MNQLQHSTSLYLQQHKNNPVQWRLWNKETLAEAKNKKMPILLSSGYAACHWCHVMAHESFEDLAIAEIINQNFIPIKIDREERPEIDALYMDALQSLGQPGGWPLTMFLDEDANPFWGGTYFPHPARGGMLGFREVLLAVAKLWNEQKEQVIKNREALKKSAEEKFHRQRGGSIDKKVIGRMAQQLAQNFDGEKGGLQGAPKFANLPMMNFLWQEGKHEVVIKTLKAICLGGIYDHLGGGVARYAVDENWLIPHFEKMLYDNGMLLWSLAEVYRETQSDLFKQRIDETIKFLERDMLLRDDNGGGGFAASLDADSPNELGEKREGAFYVWQASEIDKLLGDKADTFKQVYGVTEEGNWIEERTNVLFLKSPPPELAKEKGILFAAREQRAKPARDEKIIASWNGLAIEGIAHAGWALDNPAYVALAEDVFALVEQALNKNNRLVHSSCKGEVIAPCLLDDLAAMAAAAMTLFFITQKEFYLERVRAYAQEATEHFAAGDDGGFYLSADDADDIPLTQLGRAINAQDGVMPAANSLWWRVFLQLSILEGGNTNWKQAEAIEQGFGADVVKNFPAHATFLANLKRAENLLHIFIVDDDGSLANELRAISLPLVPIIVPIVSGRSGKSEKKAINNKPTAYICLGNRCLEPTNDKEEMIKTLRELKQEN